MIKSLSNANNRQILWGGGDYKGAKNRQCVVFVIEIFGLWLKQQTSSIPVDFD